MLEVAEHFASEEVVSHVGNGPFDPGLVGWGAHARRVDAEPASLCVFEEHVVESWRGVFGRRHDRLHVVRIMCPVALCGAFGVEPPNHGGGRTGDGDRGNITLRARRAN